MKKAVLDQLFLGFLLLMGIVTFVATVNDETSTRNYIYDLKALVKSSANAMARHYESNIDMCAAQNITTSILNQQKLGNEALSNQLVSYRWWDNDGDGEPDQVTASIAQHPYDTFWYRFFDKDDFTVGPFSWTEPVDASTLTLTMGNGITSNNSSIGMYQLDNNNCVTNTNLLFGSQWTPNPGDTIAEGIKSPPNYFFIIPKGGYDFSGSGFGETVTLDSTHCEGDSNSHSITIGGITKTKEIYFEHNRLNKTTVSTEDPFVQKIPRNVWDIYNNQFGAGEGIATSYNNFLDYCQTQAFADLAKAANSDDDETNDIIDCITDPNDQYEYGFEDYEYGDDDYNDVFFNAERIVTKNDAQVFSVNSDNSINLTCAGNSAPTLTIQCPSPIDENTTSTFSFTSSDDKWISSLTGSASNGSISIGTDTITYTPDTNFNGNDIITIIATDNEGSSNIQTCTITVNNINQAPVISGNPMTTIQAGSIYSFVPVASDPDGDNLTFSISNKPSWANFDTSTGQLFGSPNNSNVGTYSNIVISVSDGIASSSLTSFSISVTENTNNNPPSCLSIPDQTATEKEQFSINLDNYCTDSDGDNVSYTYTILSYSGSTNDIINTTIPDNTASNTPYIVSINASDGTDSITTSFRLTISANAECNGPFEVNFNNNSDSFAGGNRDGKSYKINGRGTATRTFDFGSGCSNQTINISYTFMTTGNWEERWGDRFRVYSNSQRKATHGENPSWVTSSFSATTNSNGKITLDFSAETNRSNEIVWIDDIMLSSN